MRADNEGGPRLSQDMGRNRTNAPNYLVVQLFPNRASVKSTATWDAKIILLCSRPAYAGVSGIPQRGQ